MLLFSLVVTAGPKTLPKRYGNSERTVFRTTFRTNTVQLLMEVLTMASTKTRRLELRTDENTDELITEAAELLHVTKSAFVTDAARQAAQKVISRADITLMAPEVFDSMMASLNVPDESAELAALSKLPRLIGR